MSFESNVTWFSNSHGRESLVMPSQLRTLIAQHTANLCLVKSPYLRGQGRTKAQTKTPVVCVNASFCRTKNENDLKMKGISEIARIFGDN